MCLTLSTTSASTTMLFIALRTIGVTTAFTSITVGGIRVSTKSIRIAKDASALLNEHKAESDYSNPYDQMKIEFVFTRCE